MRAFAHAHYCITDDEPPMKIVCLCSTGRDHSEEEFDSAIPVTATPMPEAEAA